MRRFNPFGGSKNAIKIVPVGSEEIGVIYFEKKGYLVPKLNPIDVQEMNRQSAKVMVLTEEAVRRMCKAKNILESEARKLLFGFEENGVKVESRENIEDWLSQEARIEMIALNLNAVNRYKVATLYLKYSFAYDVTIAQNIEASSTQTEIAVKPLKFPLAIGERIKIEGNILEVMRAAQEEESAIVVKQVPQNIASGTVGFILDFETGKEKLGIPWWTEEDTQSGMLSEPQITAIYQFYQEEVGMRTPEEPKANTSEPEVKEEDPKASTIESMNSGHILEANRSTGLSATSESSPTESAIPDSNSRTLETVPIG
jgi:hypothetical protein